VDQVLEALSPALTAELERVIEENRQVLERDFQNRLAGAIRETEQNMRVTADAQRQQAGQQAIEGTRKTVRDQVTAGLQPEFERRVNEVRHEVRQQVTSELQPEFDRRLQELHGRAATDQAAAQKAQTESEETRRRLQQQVDEWRIFADAQRQLTEAGSQPE